MQGIRNKWIGLKVRIDKTKQVGIIIDTKDLTNKDLKNHFIVEIKEQRYEFNRADFTAIRN